MPTHCADNWIVSRWIRIHFDENTEALANGNIDALTFVWLHIHTIDFNDRDIMFLNPNMEITKCTNVDDVKVHSLTRANMIAPVLGLPH